MSPPRVRIRVRTLLLAVAAVAAALGALRSVEMWHKADVCRRWADDYSLRAARGRDEASRPGIDPREAARARLDADRLERIGRRYREVADRPWLPYPGLPLLPEFAARGGASPTR